MSSLSFGDLTMTSVSFPELKSLKPPPPLATAEHFHHHINHTEKEGSTSGSDSEHHHQNQLQHHNNSTKTGGMPSPRKSVEFILHPPPPKRTKLDTAWSAKQVVDAVSTSIAPHERLEAIQKTKEALDHENQRGHDEEISSGLDSVLVKHLAFVLTSSKASNDLDGSEMTMTEISLALECLELLYRASSMIVGASFRRMGLTLLGLLNTIVSDEIQRRTKRIKKPTQEEEKKEHHEESHTDEEQHDNSRPNTPPQDQQQGVQLFEVGTPEGDIILKKATRIFGHFARVGEATKPMAYFPGFVQGLVRMVALQPYDNLPWEARLSALWCIANLACNGDNMEMMVQVPGLVSALIEVSHRPLHPGTSLEHTMEVLRARSIASRAILNLSWSPGNKQRMAANTDLLDLLTELVLRRNAPLSKSRTVRDIIATTRRHAVGAIRNIAAASRTSKVALCNYKTGHILDVLTEAALNDPDQSTVDRAFAAINNLANHDTAVQIVSHPALVMALKDVLMSSNSNDNEQGTPKSHASATLLVLERSIRPDMPEYENLKGLLEAMNPENDNSSDGIESEMDTVEPTAV